MKVELVELGKWTAKKGVKTDHKYIYTPFIKLSNKNRDIMVALEYPTDSECTCELSYIINNTMRQLQKIGKKYKTFDEMRGHIYRINQYVYLTKETWNVQKGDNLPF